MSHHTRKLSPEVAQQILEAYQQKVSVPDVARRFGATPYHVKVCIRAQGGQIRSVAETNRLRSKPLDLDELRRLNDEGVLSQREIAAKMDVSVPVIERTLRRLELRSKRGRGAPLEKNYFWKGGRYPDRQRYILVRCPDHPFANKQGYVREHRLVMEKVLGRYLKPEEVVHHKDRNRQNNHPDNLELFASNAEHFQIAHKDIWKE